MRFDKSALAKLGAASVVLALSVSYFAYVFQFTHRTPLEFGLGDWVDPYFINYLMEHWYHSVWSLADPSSPPMYYPVRDTLGYSHGLILYAPFYLAVRPFLDAFQAYTLTLFLVMEIGSLCLYVVLRNFLGLRFVEALLLSAFFFMSQNVVNGLTGIWSQRASVFLVPPILLMGLGSRRISVGHPRLVLAGLAGLLATLLYTQDFYTGHFAFFFATVCVAATLLFGRTTTVRERIVSLWSSDRQWNGACAFGGLIGCLVFVGIYFAAYREHRAFPEDQLLSSLLTRDPAVWKHPRDFVDALGGYDSFRSFTLVFLVGVVAWLPGLRTSRRARIYSLWFLILSFIVLLVPLRFNELSIWRVLFEPLPGFGVIRDPKRIIYLYELTVALLAGLFVAQLPSRSLFRIAISVLVGYLLVTERNRVVLEFLRPVRAFEQLVKAPIHVDPSCQSFFIKGASTEYMSRSNHMWTLYGVDSMFIALDHSIPTLNGYSAWTPDGWGLANPQEPAYGRAVDRWIERHHLSHVCELDIEARTMKPYSPAAHTTGSTE